jgi:hypothetical protein
MGRPRNQPQNPSNIILFNRNERLINAGGLTLAGKLLAKTDLRTRLQTVGAPKGYIHQNYECVAGYMGLLIQGKTDYADMEEMQFDPSYYCSALKMQSIASPETVRQRLDDIGFELAATDLLMEENVKLLTQNNVKPTSAQTGHVPLDIDVSVHDNSQTKKEGVRRTYKGIDGFAPIYAYLGTEGYLINAELREGNIHSQNDTDIFLSSSIRFARQVTPEKLLVRLDSGNDALDNIKVCHTEKVDYIIKRNLRKESEASWLETAKQHGTVVQPREGKKVYTGSVMRDRGLEAPLRIVFQVTERTIMANGQMLFEPKLDIQTWWASLPDAPETIIRLYHEHAVCEQFHSEIKSDIGLERFPSGHFDTNAAILKIMVLAFNVLRIIGQTARNSGIKLNRRDVSRMRLKTVINRFVFIAVHITTHARRLGMSLGRSNIWRDGFCRLYAAFG